MNTFSKTGDGLSKDVAPPSKASTSGSTRNRLEALVPTASGGGDSVSIDPEQGTSILTTTAYSRGFMEGNYVERKYVGTVAVTGVEFTSGPGCFTTYDAKQLQAYYVKRVVSPFEFYLEREIETKSDGSSRHQKMQEFYEKTEKHAFEYLITVSKMKCYAYYDGNTNAWWRVRVLDFESDEKNRLNHAYIYYCDTGKQEYILCEGLRNLPEQFQGVSGSVVLKCYLYDVLPIKGDLHWSARSIIFFSEWIENQRLGAVVMKWSKQPVVEHSPDFTFDCGVVLVELGDTIPETFNRIMVDLGYARSTGLMSCSAKALEIPGFVPHFKNKTEVPKAKKHPEKKTEKSPEELLKGRQYGTPLPEIRDIVSKHMPGRRPDNRPPLLDITPQPRKTRVQYKLTSKIKKRLAKVELSYVEGPDKIFVHTEKNILQLKAMEKEILAGLREAKPPQPSIEELEHGSVVVCSMIHRKKRFDKWCRAFVLEVNLTIGAVKVILVDYGNILWVAHQLIYKLSPKYQSIPSFVHRVHLRDIRPIFKGLTWDEPIRKFFFKYVFSYQKQQPSYLLHIAGKEDGVKFDDLDQRVVFNESESKWIAGNPSHSGHENALLASMRNNPLLASHFYSHAVDMMYERFVKDTEFWDFEHLSNYLVKRSHAEPVESKVDKNTIHEVISNGFGFL